MAWSLEINPVSHKGDAPSSEKLFFYGATQILLEKVSSSFLEFFYPFLLSF
jgi:hypothetical protein